jgi:nitrogen fixation protein FixH
MKIPPHIAWPGAIVALLLLGIGSAFTILIASRSDGGAQVIENYYERAVDWDAEADRQAASARLGWTLHIQVASVANGNPLRDVEATVRDREGTPVAGLVGTLRLSRPQHARPVAELPLAPVPDQPGSYRQAMPIDAPGLWDFQILARRDTSHFQATVRREVR